MTFRPTAIRWARYRVQSRIFDAFWIGCARQEEWPFSLTNGRDARQGRPIQLTPTTRESSPNGLISVNFGLPTSYSLSVILQNRGRSSATNTVTCTTIPEGACQASLSHRCALMWFWGSPRTQELGRLPNARLEGGGARHKNMNLCANLMCVIRSTTLIPRRVQLAFNIARFPPLHIANRNKGNNLEFSPTCFPYYSNILAALAMCLLHCEYLL